MMFRHNSWEAQLHWKKMARGALLAWTLGVANVLAADIEGQKLSLPTPERAVDVTYFRAPGDGLRPAALLLHGAGGFDGQIANYDRYASELAKNGIDAYLVYYYSAADKAGMQRGDEVFQKRYAAWAKMVDDLADSLEKKKDSNGKVGLVGFSNGAILASGAGARDPKISAAVIYYGGAPWPTLGPVTRFPPLLILHGDADQIIPVREGHMLAEFAQERGAKVDLVIYPGESHGFGSRLATKNGADALKRTIAFLRQELDVR
ncbi:MAG TPA: dienelactone hydrolase family protein [Rhizomicrobium sp.]|jgi:carboxymethylenebutenolidase|nr:dienelactone hydrolase family protein [Rhizomicrobium sp.]